MLLMHLFDKLLKYVYFHLMSTPPTLNPCPFYIWCAFNDYYDHFSGFTVFCSEYITLLLSSLKLEVIPSVYIKRGWTFCLLLVGRYIFARCPLLFARCSLIFACCSLLFARCSLFVTFWSLLVTFCFLLVTFSSVECYESII